MMDKVRLLVGSLVWAYGVFLLSLPGIEAGESLAPAGAYAVTQTFRAVFAMIVGSLILARQMAKQPHWQKFPYFLLAAATGGVAVAALGGTSWLDDAFYRSLWEGGVAATESSVHELTPHDYVGSIFQPPVFQKVPYKDLGAYSPPLAVLWWQFLYLVAGDQFGFWLLAQLFLTTLALGLTGYFCFVMQVPRWLVVLILLHPLWSKDFGDSLHIDVLAYIFVMLALLMVRRVRGLAVGGIPLHLYPIGMLLAAGFLAQPLVLIWLLFLPSMTLWQRLHIGLSFMVSVVAGSALYFDSWNEFVHYSHYLAVFSEFNIFNPGFADLIRYLLSLFTGGGLEETWLHGAFISKLIASILLVGGTIWFLAERLGRQGEIRIWFIGGFLSLMPGFHSWYLIFLFPGFILLPWRRNPLASIWSLAPFYALGIQAFMGYAYWAYRMDQVVLRQATWLFYYAILCFCLWRLLNLGVVRK